jgi:hypothetical protein
MNTVSKRISKRLTQVAVLAVVATGISLPSFAQETSNSTFSLLVTPPIDPCAGMPDTPPTWMPDTSVSLEDNRGNQGIGTLGVESGASVNMSVGLNFGTGETCVEGIYQQVLADGGITATWNVPTGLTMAIASCNGVDSFCTASTTSSLFANAQVAMDADGTYPGSVDIVWVPAG